MPMLGDDRFARIQFALNDIKYTGAWDRSVEFEIILHFYTLTFARVS